MHFLQGSTHGKTYPKSAYGSNTGISMDLRPKKKSERALSVKEIVIPYGTSVSAFNVFEGRGSHGPNYDMTG